MPTYEYKCESCGERMEVFASMSAPPPAACDSCGAATLTKVLFPVAVHYKGSGFYSTDYAKSKASDSSRSSSEQAKPDSGASSASIESSSAPASSTSSGASDN